MRKACFRDGQRINQRAFGCVWFRDNRALPVVFHDHSFFCLVENIGCAFLQRATRACGKSSSQRCFFRRVGVKTAAISDAAPRHLPRVVAWVPEVSANAQAWQKLAASPSVKFGPPSDIDPTQRPHTLGPEAKGVAHGTNRWLPRPPGRMQNVSHFTIHRVANPVHDKAGDVLLADARSLTEAARHAAVVAMLHQKFARRGLIP